MTAFLDPVFAGSNAKVLPVETFPEQFEMTRLLHKVALLWRGCE
jgi:hypothetical protein